MEYSKVYNDALIHVYKNIQSNHNELYQELQNLIKDFTECTDGPLNREPTTLEEAKTKKENFYYWIRSQYNAMSIETKRTVIGSAMFIFLNKTCFRGVFRVGPNGFNVPYGNYTNPEIINKPHLDRINDLIRPVIFEVSDFNTSMSLVAPNDFVYIDPPYVPEKSTSFVKYTENGFNVSDHIKLFTLIHNLTEKRIKVLLSNSDTIIVRNAFSATNYDISTIVCRRSINSKKPESVTNEVIIKNYTLIHESSEAK